MPNILLAEIFVQYVPAYPICPPLIGDGSPAKLLLVSRSWRDLALSTPSLWTRIKLFDGPGTPEIHLKVAKLWLERSRSLPLSVSIAGEWGRYDEGFESRVRALSFLLRHRARWEYAYLHLPDIPYSIRNRVDLHPEPFGGSFPLLRELDIQFETAQWKGRYPFLHIDAPLLRHAFYRVDIIVPTHNLDTILPLAQLTRLTLRHLDVFTAAPLLRHTKSLVHCRLDLRDEDDELATGAGPTGIDLPHLKTLVLGAHPYHRPTRAPLLRFLTSLAAGAPTLQNLAIELLLLTGVIGPFNVLEAFAALRRACSFVFPLARVCIMGLWSSAYPREDECLAQFPVRFPEIGCLEIGTSARPYSPPVQGWGKWDLLEL
ncbi:F-box domain-containing protein [Mycena kentingensis (nom. inval.)]|nr:F-box domain-containing protein [Mycena kentingensis (nom. inval.)]